MATAQYTPQSGAPTRSTKFAPTMGLAEIVAIAAIPGESAPSEFGAPEVKFRLVDGRTWYVPMSIADEIYRAKIAPRQQMEVVKIGRAKHELRITGLDAHSGLSQNGTGGALTPPAPTSKSSNYTSHQHNPAPAPVVTVGGRPTRPMTADEERALGFAPPAPNPAQTACTKTLAGALIASIDAYLIASDYAKSKGIKVDLELAFNAEDISASATTLMIECFKRGAA